ncbi:hypothetical protein C8F04DRAFT_1121163 [Mycena alexandri]|uniref:Uncharacterized protein n=1 Tax=Mycena alexandri TaxID=1745969 RepID=A0AAD6SIS5_9AGAR|nr:hypothetical protein C8F04DRAFT_1121163 [Mycena alexandri]
MSSSYSVFYKSGLHGHASSVYTYSHPRDDDMDHENPSHSATADLAYFAAAAPYHITSSNINNRVAQGPRSPTRKRRSSLTSAASPVSALKLRSPARAAGNAWHMAHMASSPSRSRSGSLNVASEGTSMLGRMRSGSVGARLRARKPLTNRRPVALLFAPTPPPPSAPLPALPLCAPARPPFSRLAIQLPALPVADGVFYKPSAGPASPVPSSPSTEYYHAPGAWMGFGTIDEEMKEN